MKLHKFVAMLLLIECSLIFTLQKGYDQCGENDCEEEPEKHVLLESIRLEKLKAFALQQGKDPILIWWYGTDSIYPHSQYEDLSTLNCGEHTCKVSRNRQYQHNLSARGFIFYGTSFLADDLPLPRQPYHEWGIIHEESPKNSWMLSHRQGISLFNHTATFRRESDYPLSTQYIRDVDDWMTDTYYVTTSEKNRYQKEHGYAPAVFVQRDCNPPSDRDSYVRELMKYMPIDSYGPCLNNKNMPADIDGFHHLASEQFYHFLARYKFQIAFENAVCQDYMTEKLFRPLEIGSVPVYYGSSKVRDFMPSGRSVIVVDDFQSPAQLANYLMELNANDTRYEEYLAHRKQGITNPVLLQLLARQPWKLPHRDHKMNFGYYMFSGFTCYLCKKIHERNENILAHLEDPSIPLLPPSIGRLEHMDCPKPFSSLSGGGPRFSCYDEGGVEADAIHRMLAANESDSKVFKQKYLIVDTDKYPKQHR